MRENEFLREGWKEKTYLLWPLVKMLNIQSCFTSAYFITFTACLLFVCFKCTLQRTSTFAVYCLQEQFSEVLDAMFEVLVKPQQHIIDQGDDGDNFYVIDKLVSDLKAPLSCLHQIFVYPLCVVSFHRGLYDIFIQKDGVSVCVGKYDNKGSFGELALMYNTPRAATIVATQDGALWALVSSVGDAFL